MDKKEEAADQLGRHSPSNKFCEDYFCSPVGQGAVPEEQVSESVEVFHLDVGHFKFIWRRYNSAFIP